MSPTGSLRRSEALHRGAEAGKVPWRRRAPVLLAAGLALAALATGCRHKVTIVADATPEGAANPDRATASVPAPAPCARVPGSFAEVAGRLSPLLVTVLGPEAAASGPLLAFPLLPSGGEAPEPTAPSALASIGTGFVVDGQRLVVTSARVAGDAPSLTVRFADGRTVEATVRGLDPDLDLALLSLEQPLRETLTLSDAARPRPGDWVAVLANPFGADATVTVGVVRAVSEGSDGEPRGPFAPFLALDATVDAASWGGAVVDSSGRLVGMAVAGSAPATRVGLVLPTGELRRAAAAIHERGGPSRVWLGLWVRPLEEQAGGDRSLVVTSIVAGGPADNAGIRPGDVLLEFAGEPVASPSRLAALASRVPVDQDVPFVLQRDGTRLSHHIRPAAMPQ